MLDMDEIIDLYYDTGDVFYNQWRLMLMRYETTIQAELSVPFMEYFTDDRVMSIMLFCIPDNPHADLEYCHNLLNGIEVFFGKEAACSIVYMLTIKYLRYHNHIKGMTDNAQSLTDILIKEKYLFVKKVDHGMLVSTFRSSVDESFDSHDPKEILDRFKL